MYPTPNPIAVNGNLLNEVAASYAATTLGREGSLR